MSKSTIRIEFISEGFKQILQSEGVKEMISAKAEEIATRANANGDCEGFKATTMLGGYGGGRWIGFVTATDKESMKAESENKSLTGAIT